MKSGWGKWVTAVLELFLATAAMPSAGAQCGIAPKSLKSMRWQPDAKGGANLRLTALKAAADENASTPTIVGLWHVTFIADSSNGEPIPKTVIDNALVAWHSDHTEIMKSARPPQDGNFCSACGTRRVS